MGFNIELLPGSDLKRVVDFMLEHKSKGRSVNCNFKGIEFDSNDVSIIANKMVIALKNKDNKFENIINFLLECKKHNIEGYFEYNNSVIISAKNISTDEETIKIVIDSLDGSNIEEIDVFLSECDTLDIVGMCNYAGGVIVSDNYKREITLEEPNDKHYKK